MSIASTIASIGLRRHGGRVDMYSQYPDETQFQLFGDLLRKAARTDIGLAYGFGNLSSMGPLEFAERVPLCRQDEARDMLAALSENSNAKISSWMSAKDIAASYLRKNPGSGLFSGKMLLMGGSEYFGKIPFWLSGNCVYDWEVASRENVACICGYPAAILSCMQKMLRKSGKSKVSEIWPALELVVFAGVDARPYAAAIEGAVSSQKLKMVSTLSGPEGLMAFQDQGLDDGLLLMLDNGIYYEVIPEEDLQNAGCKAVPLKEAKPGRRYALVMSGNGLWRYVSGYIVELVSARPCRIRAVDNMYLVSNAFGERITKSQASKALRSACMATGAEFSGFSVKPLLVDPDLPARLEWSVNFSIPPNDAGNFANTFDFELKSINESYNALRYRDLAIGRPVFG